jgi:hypothetical protein
VHNQLAKVGKWYTKAMLNPANANLVGGVAAFLSLMGTTPVLSDDVHGFFVVLGSLVAIASFVWSHIAHRQTVAGIRAGTIK